MLFQVARDGKKNAKDLKEFIKSIQSEEGELTIGCEICDCKDAADAEFGWFLSFGIYPVAGLYRWQPERRLLCKKHASRTCLKNNILTGFLGYLGFPGVFVSPYRLWLNMVALRKTGRINPLFLVLNIVVGAVYPCIFVGLLIFRMATK